MKKILTLLILSGFISITGYVARADTFTVNTTDDTVDANPGDGIAADASGNCSLRAAIMEANAFAGKDNILLPGGIFTLTIEGTQEDDCLTGDLDVRSSVVIQGMGWNSTFIDGNQLDRVIQIQGKVEVSLFDLTIRNGKTPDGGSPPALTVGGSGGGILNRSATLNIENCKIIHNGTGKGGASSTDYGSPGGYGGGIYNKQGTVLIKNSSVSNNRTGRGGASYYFDGGSGGHGGGIYNCPDSTVALDNCIISQNMTGKFGPGGWEDGVGGSGGGICNRGELTLIDCTIGDNICGDGGYEGSGGYGGGIYNSSLGSADISRSLITGNITGDSESDGSGGSGGGISNRGYLFIRNCTLSFNRTKPGFYLGVGGGINNEYEGDATLHNCTIFKNFGHELGGGIYNDPWNSSATLRIKNTIVANNSISFHYYEYTYLNDCHGIMTSQGYNLITKIAGCTISGIQTGNIYGSKPLLGALADNGGPTLTHRLLPASPAVDAGHPTDFESTDQRGVSRPKDGDGDGSARSDIGAFELFSPTVTITSPGAGESVSGSITIEATANTEYVDFFIDNVPLCEVVASPFLCILDTILYANGSHKIKARAYDAEDLGLVAESQLNVLIDNTLIDLHAFRFTDKAWIIRREYGRVTFAVIHAGWLEVSKYIVERREKGGSYSTITEIDGSNLVGNSYTYNDPLPNKDASYTYRVRAVSGTDMNVGISEEETI